MSSSPFIGFIAQLLNLYKYLIIGHYAIIWLIRFEVLNAYHPFIQRFQEFAIQISEPLLARIRKFTPKFQSLDISPIILLLLIELARNILYSF